MSVDYICPECGAILEEVRTDLHPVCTECGAEMFLDDDDEDDEELGRID